MKTLFLREPNLSPYHIKLNLDERIDFLSAGRWIIQRAKGHRATSDDQLLAWMLYRTWSSPHPPTILELGAGKGTISLILSALWAQAQFIAIEAYEESHSLSKKNCTLNQIESRFKALLGDLRDPKMIQQALVYAKEKDRTSLVARETLQERQNQDGFDLICGAPPFMPIGSGILPHDPQRATGRFELKGGVEDYLSSMAICLSSRPNSRAIILMDGQSHQRTINAIDHWPNLVLLQITRVCPRPHLSPTYEIFELGHSAHHRTSDKQVDQIIYQRDSEGDDWSQAYQEIREKLGIHTPIPLVFIPARLHSTRLKNKALVDLHGAPMIARVVENLSRLMPANKLVVTSDSEDVLTAAQSLSPQPIHQCLITDPCHSGSQRVLRAFERYPTQPESPWIINVQGDEPLLPLSSLEALIEALIHFERKGIYIATLASPLPLEPSDRQATLDQQSLVKVCLGDFKGELGVSPHHPQTLSWRRALYFTRCPTGTHQHLGVYAFHQSILPLIDQERGLLAKLEDLEQITWLERGADIGVVCLIEPHPPGVDTPQDLERARAYYHHKD